MRGELEISSYHTIYKLFGASYYKSMKNMCQVSSSEAIFNCFRVGIFLCGLETLCQWIGYISGGMGSLLIKDNDELRKHPAFKRHSTRKNIRKVL